MGESTQTNVLLEPEDRKRLDRLAAEHGYGVGETLRRGLRTLDRGLAYYAARARELDDETGRLMWRVATELGPEWLVGFRVIPAGDAEYDGPSIASGKLQYFEDNQGVLRAMDLRREIYTVEDGQLYPEAVVFTEQMSAN